MKSLTALEEQSIRDFLRYCLADGLFGFKIEGKHYLLESDDDIEPITQAIKNAQPPVIRYRVKQAQQALSRMQQIRRHREPVLG